MRKTDVTLLIVITLVVIGAAAAGWYFRDILMPPPEPEPAIESPTPIEPVADEGPRYPMPEAVGTEPRDLVPLPPLDDSDAYFLLEIGNVFGTGIESLLKREAVIDRLVTTIDNLPRGKLAEDIRPVERLGEAFIVDTGDDDSVILGISSYARYDAIIAQIYYADLDAVYNTYRRFYPLFQKSYERLGYPDAYFNDRLIEVIDHLLATPTPEKPIRLVRPNVLYEFADPELEALSSGQKLLLRMGPGNAATLKRVLSKLRDQLD